MLYLGIQTTPLREYVPDIRAVISTEDLQNSPENFFRSEVISSASSLLTGNPYTTFTAIEHNPYGVEAPFQRTRTLQDLMGGIIKRENGGFNLFSVNEDISIEQSLFSQEIIDDLRIEMGDIYLVKRYVSINYFDIYNPEESAVQIEVDYIEIDIAFDGSDNPIAIVKRSTASRLYGDSNIYVPTESTRTNFGEIVPEEEAHPANTTRESMRAISGFLPGEFESRIQGIEYGETVPYSFYVQGYREVR